MIDYIYKDMDSTTLKKFNRSFDRTLLDTNVPNKKVKFFLKSKK